MTDVSSELDSRWCWQTEAATGAKAAESGLGSPGSAPDPSCCAVLRVEGLDDAMEGRRLDRWDSTVLVLEFFLTLSPCVELRG